MNYFAALLFSIYVLLTGALFYEKSRMDKKHKLILKEYSKLFNKLEGKCNGK